MQYLHSILHNRSEETIKVYKSLCANHFNEYPDKSIDFLFAEWKRKKLSAETIKKLLKIYKTWYKFHYKTEPDVSYYKLNVYKSVFNKKEVLLWSKAEARKALDYSKGDDSLYLILLLGLHTGCRPGEIFGAKWSDVDFENKKINIIRSKTKKIVNIIKNGQARSIDLTEELFNTLQKFYKPENRDDFILPDYNIRHWLDKLCKDLKIPKISTHKLRHIFATLGLDAGVSVRDIAHILGHKRVSTTMDFYWKSIKAVNINFAP